MLFVFRSYMYFENPEDWRIFPYYFVSFNEKFSFFVLWSREEREEREKRERRARLLMGGAGAGAGAGLCQSCSCERQPQ